MRMVHAQMAFLVSKKQTDGKTQWRVLSNVKRYIADHVYALPTVAFFMCGIGVFAIGHLVSYYIIGLVFPKFREPKPWRMLIAIIRYLSYRGFHVASLGFNSAPVGVLVLGLIGAIFFFCKWMEQCRKCAIINVR